VNAVVINIIFAGLGALIAIAGFYRYLKKDTQEETACNTRMETKIDNISVGVNDIKFDMRVQGAKIETISERLTRVEESSKSAHKRIDELEK
jgi:hypothetical protein